MSALVPPLDFHHLPDGAVGAGVAGGGCGLDVEAINLIGLELGKEDLGSGQVGLEGDNEALGGLTAELEGEVLGAEAISDEVAHARALEAVEGNQVVLASLDLEAPEANLAGARGVGADRLGLGLEAHLLGAAEAVNLSLVLAGDDEAARPGARACRVGDRLVGGDGLIVAVRPKLHRLSVVGRCHG